MPGLAFGAAPTGIKQVLRGTINIANATATGTATIAPVVMAKAELRHLGQRSGSAAFTDVMATVALTNSTTVTATRAGSTGACDVSWELTEFY